MMSSFTLSGNIVDIVHRKIFPGTLKVNNGSIISVTHDAGIKYDQFILPGFIDAHIHIESSMLIPSEFARIAVLHGTVGTVSDPHEIANVLGFNGVQYMIQNGKQVPFHFFFGAPSCVPATTFETAGAALTAEEIRLLFTKDNLLYLSEMMNYPGVLHQDPLVMDKIQVAKECNRPIDGHAPGLRGDDAKRYIAAGISTDHECFTLPEALDKLKFGMKILIREGSAAKNYNALHSLIRTHPTEVMLCSDDKHPHELVEGHINQLVKLSIIKHEYDLMDVLRCASYNPIKHYKLDVGLLQVGDSADFIVVNNLFDFKIQQTYIKGICVADAGKPLIASITAEQPNHFNIQPKTPFDFLIKAVGEQIHVIHALEGQLITEKLQMAATIKDGHYICNLSEDILKIAVVNRYQEMPPVAAFIKGFGLKEGAIASCIAHDSHNIIAVGTNDGDLCDAINAIIKNKGGISIANKGLIETLPLPVAGIMSANDGFKVAKQYAKIDQLAKTLGTPLQAPFMTLSFMALLVIPSLKISDKGLFDGSTFKLISVGI